MNPNGIDMAEVDFDDEPRCDYCEKLTHGDYRRIERLGTITIACGRCTDHWDDDAEREAVPA